MIVALVFLPLCAALIAGLGGRVLGATVAKLVTTGALFLACALAWPIFIGFLTGHQVARVEPLLLWMHSGALSFDWSLRVDTLTAVMLVVVTSVSALVHLYSWGYMAEDPDQARFFSYLSLFTFAMLMLVTSDNLVQMFFGWEGVGLASYLLIGFWYKKPSANAAAIKAFVINRVGDFGFTLGIVAAILVFGTVSIPAILAAVPAVQGSTIGFMGLRVDTLTLITILLFIGAMGKSAQLGLHTWLPDAMEGPTPVSALIHAATMVTAGVFMLCRLSPMFAASATTMAVILGVGAATHLFAGTVGTTQNDIKRVIAYSTCSQLGLMFAAAGVGAFSGAMFHLFTHAFFKALLFLGAGSVIHAMHHEQDMRHYGGLRTRIPFTFWMMMAGTLAITGVGIVGVFGFAGFYSKDGIVEALFASGTTEGRLGFVVALIGACLTSFYSWRLMFLTFWGKPRWATSEHIQHAAHGDGHEHGAGHAAAASHQPGDGTLGYVPHESPVVMLIPLAILAVGAVLAGAVFHHAFIGTDAGDHFWAGSLLFDGHLAHAMHGVPLWVKWSATVAMLVGLCIAWAAYIRDPSVPGRFTHTFPGLYHFLLNKWYFDELYHFIFVRPALAMGRFFWKTVDIGMIDRFGPDGVAHLVAGGARMARRVQSGYLYTYALAMLIGLAAAATWMIV